MPITPRVTTNMVKAIGVFLLAGAPLLGNCPLPRTGFWAKWISGSTA